MHYLENMSSLSLSLSSILGSIFSSSSYFSSHLSHGTINFNFSFTFPLTFMSLLLSLSICLSINRPNTTNHITKILQVPWDYHFITRSYGTTKPAAFWVAFSPLNPCHSPSLHGQYPNIHGFGDYYFPDVRWDLGTLSSNSSSISSEGKN